MSNCRVYIRDYKIDFRTTNRQTKRLAFTDKDALAAELHEFSVLNDTIISVYVNLSDPIHPDIVEIWEVFERYFPWDHFLFGGELVVVSIPERCARTVYRQLLYRVDSFRLNPVNVMSLITYVTTAARDVVYDNITEFVVENTNLVESDQFRQLSCRRFPNINKMNITRPLGDASAHAWNIAMHWAASFDKLLELDLREATFTTVGVLPNIKLVTFEFTMTLDNEDRMLKRISDIVCHYRFPHCVQLSIPIFLTDEAAAVHGEVNLPDDGMDLQPELMWPYLIVRDPEEKDAFTANLGKIIQHYVADSPSFARFVIYDSYEQSIFPYRVEMWTRDFIAVTRTLVALQSMITHIRLSTHAPLAKVFRAHKISSPMDQLTMLRDTLLNRFSASYLFAPGTDEENRLVIAMHGEDVSDDDD